MAVSGPDCFGVRRDDPVSSVFFVGMIVALVYGAMFAMVTFLHPEPHQIVESVPLPKIPK